MSELDKKFEDWMDEKIPAIYQGQRVMLHRYDTMDASEETIAKSAWHAAKASCKPKWSPMSEDPPFPFSGDICVNGKVILGAAWCAGYWQTSGRNVDRERVSHWKFPNREVLPPESLS